MLRIHFMQQWFTLSDPAMEEALHDTPLLREFAALDWDTTHLKSSVRAKVEHPFQVLKRQFGHVKVRYRGPKNTAQLTTPFALSNLWLWFDGTGRRTLQPPNHPTHFIPHMRVKFCDCGSRFVLHTLQVSKERMMSMVRFLAIVLTLFVSAAHAQLFGNGPKLDTMQNFDAGRFQFSTKFDLGWYHVVKWLDKSDQHVGRLADITGRATLYFGSIDKANPKGYDRFNDDGADHGRINLQPTALPRR